MYYRSGLDDNTAWGSWIKLLDVGNSYVTGGKGVINGTTITQVDNAANADTVDGYHASSLWRSDGATWDPYANISLTASGNNQEWSFDIKRNGYTNCYWQVWDSALSTLLKVNADNGKVYAPYNFVGNLEGNASSTTNADMLDGEHASAFTRIVGRHTIYTSGTAPYNYIHLFRIANSSGYSTLDCEIDIRTRYHSAKIEIRISTDQQPYNNGGSSISIVKKVVSNRTCNLWFLPTVQTSNYNYYDVYYESGAWNSGSYGITLKGTDGTLVFEHKGTNLASLPDKVIPVTYNVVASATKLATARTIWGQSFDGTGNVSGSLSEVGNIHFKVENSYDIGSDAAASKYIYTHWLGARSGRKLAVSLHI